jgi:LuxR family maltose regulon positive regulatory protein
VSELTYQIVKTRLSPPRIAGIAQRREDLLARLHKRRDKRLTSILGPAGSGKSTIAALWRQQLVGEGRQVCWYNVTRDASDPAQFLSYLVAALQPLDRQLGEAALAMFNLSGAHSSDLFIGMLANELSEIPHPFHLFLEDLHTVSDSGVPALVRQLLALAPPTLRLVVTSRMRVPLDLLHWQVRDELHEIGFADLRFSPQESISFLRQQGLTDLGPAEMHRLHTHCDGWAAGLQLHAYSIRRSKDAHAFVDRLTGPMSAHRESSLIDYMNEVMEELHTPEEVDFLVRTSACKRFNSELSAVITGNSRAQELVERFEAENLFVIPIDFADTLPWYRFHRTFAKFLNSRLLRLPPAELMRINCIASEWYAAQGLRVEAIRHAVYAGDTAACVDLIEQSARGLVGGAQFLQLLKWFAQLPPETTARRIELLLCVAWANAACGYRDDFDSCMRSIAALPESRAPGAAFELVLLRSYGLLRQDDTAAALLELEPYVADPPRGPRFSLHLLDLLAGLALVHADQFERTRDLARRCRLRFHRDAPQARTPILDAGVGLSFLRQGDVREARSILTKAVREVAHSNRSGTDPMAYLAGHLALVHYELDELDDAAAVLAEHGPLIDLIGLPDSILHAHSAHVRLLLLQGAVDTALDDVRHVETLGLERKLDRLICWSLREQVRLQAARGNTPAANEALGRLEDLAARYHAASQCAFAENPLHLQVAQVEWSIARGDLESALRGLGTLIDRYVRRGHLLEVARLRAQKACIEQRLGRFEAAEAATYSTLQLVQVYGFTRALLDAGPDLIHPLEQLLVSPQLSAAEIKLGHACIARLYSTERGGQAPASLGSSPEPHNDRLSAKELEVLGLLSRALSNKSIGRALNISAGTVKWHLRNIYSKLNAVSREDALARARDRSIID